MIIAPENFSMINNTDEVLEFFKTVSDVAASNRQPFLDMREVKSLGPDAIAYLNATIARLSEVHLVPVAGSTPRLPEIAEILRRSGFYEHVKSKSGTNYSADSGLISKEEDCIVDMANARELVWFATEHLTGSACYYQPAQIALGEFMHNTFDHASVESGAVRWWASVYYDEEQRVAHFTFLDNGVGIFGSRPVRMLHSVRRALNLTADVDLLRNLFEGKLASRTEIVWRGQGLPRVYRRVKAGHLTEMTVITNRVKAVLDRDEYTLLKSELVGTLYHWELREQSLV